MPEWLFVTFPSSLSISDTFGEEWAAAAASAAVVAALKWIDGWKDNFTSSGQLPIAAIN